MIIEEAGLVHAQAPKRGGAAKRQRPAALKPAEH